MGSLVIDWAGCIDHEESGRMMGNFGVPCDYGYGLLMWMYYGLVALSF